MSSENIDKPGYFEEKAAMARHSQKALDDALKPLPEEFDGAGSRPSTQRMLEDLLSKPRTPLPKNKPIK